MRREGFDVNLRSGLTALLCAALLALFSVAPLGCQSSASRSTGSEPTTAEAQPAEPAPEPEHGKLEPRYQPREPKPKPWYNDSLIFGMTRGVTNSTIHPAAQVPLLVLTIPLDIAFLPFAAIGGFF